MIECMISIRKTLAYQTFVTPVPLLAKARQRPGTSAMICCNDLTVVGALRGLHDMGLDVPADVSVIGFDDIESAPCVEPARTTVLLGLVAEGFRGERGEHAAEPAATQRVAVELVVRGSTGPATGGP
jgi:LacI family transcriptional regulator